MRDWISNLRVGDKVVVEEHYYGSSIKTVNNITKAGNIKVGDHLFNISGRERVTGYFPAYISEWTQEKETAINDNKIIERAKRLMKLPHLLNLEQAKKIIEILGVTE